MSEPPSRFPKDFDVIYSIGTDCTCAQHLNKLGLRTVSGPFDWLTGVSSIFPRLDLILNRFQCFIDQEHFYYDDRDKLKCDPYRNEKTGFLHLHDFPAGVPLKESFPAVREKYLRRIDRFENNLRSGKKILLVWFTNEPTADEARLIELCCRIKEELGGQIYFLLIEGKADMPQGSIECARPAEHVLLYRFFIETPVSMRQQRKCLNKILSPYRTPGAFRRRFRMNFAQVAANLVSAFVPVKSKRIACRDKIQHWLKVKKF